MMPVVISHEIPKETNYPVRCSLWRWQQFAGPVITFIWPHHLFARFLKFTMPLGGQKFCKVSSLLQRATSSGGVS